ncbi:beta-glucuronosyltransferase GlcAT14B isoform X3 [Diospyros lotus]|uniref:beta-glucuronosyltransferase GlcAT14B isoform X3 n=1 Tax=Diospyros lotus TaxID=55363 RepID=UPI00224ED7DC|nr:beta-glucuronosyltransferase GlcAT14B isoform X3 [Diospyros lotus]
MQSPAQPPPPSTAAVAGDNRVTTLYCIIAASLFSLLFVFSLSSTPHTRPPPPLDPYLFPDRQSQPSSARRHRLFIPNSVDPPPPPPPSIAYLISGSDPHRILRLLLAVYHPRNHYLLHLDLSAPQSDRQFLAVTVRSIAVFRAAQNVNVIGKADFAYPKGSSPLSSTLHGASILLRLSANWDWFINLSVADYPLVTQDDLLHILSYLPKDLNFVNHTSYIGWKESRSLKRIIVDPGLYISEKIWMFYASQKRELPDAFRLFMALCTMRTSKVIKMNFQLLREGDKLTGWWVHILKMSCGVFAHAIISFWMSCTELEQGIFSLLGSSSIILDVEYGCGSGKNRHASVV